MCRELTKVHEEYLRGSTEELLAYIEEHPVKGECCLLVEGNLFEMPVTEVDEELGTLKEQVEAKIASGENQCCYQSSSAEKWAENKKSTVSTMN